MFNKIFKKEKTQLININDYLTEELTKKGYNNYQLEHLINDYLKELLEDSDEEIEEEDNDLDDKYKWLDRKLFCNLEKEICIGINSSMVGSYEYKYILNKYTINGVYNSIRLYLKRKDDEFVIDFNHIENIDWNGNKVWIYMQEHNWRFYLNIDEEVYTALDKTFKSKYIELMEDIQVYMKYKNVDSLKYYVEKEKYKYRNTDVETSQKEVVDKRGNDIILFNIYDINSTYNKSGTIYAFSDKGVIGRFFYEIRETDLYIVDMLVDTHSQGIGSHVLSFMEEIARKYKMKEMTGMLSQFDFDHKNRLFHFYEKNEFVINSSETRIYKKLN